MTLVESYGGTKDDQDLQDILLRLYGFVRSLPWPEKWLKDVINTFRVEDNFKFETSKWAEVILDSLKVEISGILNTMLVAVDKLKNEAGLEGYFHAFQREAYEIEQLLQYDNWNEFKNHIQAIEFERLPNAGKDANKNVKEEVSNIRKK